MLTDANKHQSPDNAMEVNKQHDPSCLNRFDAGGGTPLPGERNEDDCKLQMAWPHVLMCQWRDSLFISPRCYM